MNMELRHKIYKNTAGLAWSFGLKKNSPGLQKICKIICCRNTAVQEIQEELAVLQEIAGDHARPDIVKHGNLIAIISGHRR